MNIDSFRFQVSTNLRFGVGESEKLGEELSLHGFHKTAAIIDQAVLEHLQVEKALSSAKRSGTSIDIFPNNVVEPDYDFLDNFNNLFLNKSYDCLIGIGGGSTIDITKGVAILMTNNGPAIRYRGFPKLKNKPVPIIAIPTTAGTGSELTYNAVFTDSHSKKKLGINSLMNFPICAIIDPLLTLDCPESVTVSSGTDAMVHTLESFVHRNHTIISRMYSREAFRLLFNNLLHVIKTPKDIVVRESIALGSYLAATALINSGSGAAGAYSYPLGVHYKVPHGIAGAIFLTYVTNFNISKGYNDYWQLYDLIDEADKSLPLYDKVRLFGHELEKLWRILNVPKSFATFGLSQNDIEFLIDQYDVLKPAIDQNPVEITKNDVRDMMRSLS